MFCKNPKMKDTFVVGLLSRKVESKIRSESQKSPKLTVVSSCTKCAISWTTALILFGKALVTWPSNSDWKTLLIQRLARAVRFALQMFRHSAQGLCCSGVKTKHNSRCEESMEMLDAILNNLKIRNSVQFQRHLSIHAFTLEFILTINQITPFSLFASPFWEPCLTPSSDRTWDQRSDSISTFGHHVPTP